MAYPTPPPIPGIEGSGRIYVIDPLYAGQAVVFVVSPTTAQGRVSVIPVADTARDQANIMIQTITQTYFQDNIYQFIPYEYWRMDAKSTEEGGGDGALHAYTQVFAITLDEIKQAIDELPLIFDVEHCPSRYLRTIAELLAFPLEDTDTTSEQRRQLKTAIQWYQSKGSRRAFTAILYAFGFHAEMVPLWTEDYAVFTDTIPGVSKGNDPPNDFPLLVENGGTWYRSPHYGVQLIGIVNDKHTTIEWGDATQQQQDDFEALSEEVGYHAAWYQMVDELTEANAFLVYHFDTDEFNYIYRRLEFLRPVFAVLEWLQFLTEMQENVDIPEGEEPMMTANPIREEKGWYLGYCDQDDIQYTRLDERLLGPDYLTLTSPLMSGAPGVTDVVDEVTATVDGVGETHISGTLANVWLIPGVLFTATIGAASVDITDVEELTAIEMIDYETADGVETSFSGLLMQVPIIPTGITKIEVDYGVGTEEVVLVDDGVGGITGTGVTGTISYSTGAWTLEFTVPPTDGSILVLTYLYQNTEGVLSAEGIAGVLDYLTGAWWLDFEPGYEPDDTTDIVADYSYTTGVPPTDRSGVLPRGSAELPFPHVRDPQEGYCHPPEYFDIDWTWLPEEQYTLALTRDGMGLYPPAGPVSYVDHADFPSRGFTSDATAGHANTFTRQYGYSTRPLSLLKVEENPPDTSGNWENQTDNWEIITTNWEVWG
jgi:phage tail-like protein